MQVQISQLFDQIHNIPRIPEIIRILITQFNDPKTDFNAITKNIEKEQIIALKVLRLVNSAHFGLSRKVGTIQEAVALMGLNQLRILVIACGMVNSVPKIPGVNLKHFWQDSFRTATIAKWLAAESKQEADLAFTAGLISGLGNILIHMGAPNAAQEIDEHLKSGKQTRITLETNRLGFTSYDVCAELCRRWHFSDELTDVVAKSGAPLDSAEINLGACVVFIARYISESLHTQTTPENILQAFPFSIAEKLGLSQGYIEENLPKILALESGLDGLTEGD